MIIISVSGRFWMQSRDEGDWLLQQAHGNHYLLLPLPCNCFSCTFMLQPVPVSEKPNLTMRRGKVSLVWNKCLISKDNAKLVKLLIFTSEWLFWLAVMGRRVSFTLFQRRAEEVGGRAGNRTAWLKAPVSACLGVRAMSALVLPKGDPGTVSCASSSIWRSLQLSGGRGCTYPHFPDKETRP